MNLKKSLNRVFNYAVDADYIPSNPLTRVVVKGVDNHKERNEFLEHEDFLTLVHTLDKSNLLSIKSYSIAIQLGYYAGLRLAEAVALAKDDVDFENNTININKELIYKGLLKDELYISNELKSKTSKSTLPLVEPLKNSLVEWFKVNPYQKVICDSKGRYIHPDAMSAYLGKKFRELGIDFHFHMLRHTCSTNLYNSGLDPKKIQIFMRHASISTTLNIYTHVNQVELKESVNNIFNSICAKNVHGDD